MTEICSSRLRWTALKNDQMNANTPTANNTIAVTAPTHWLAVENTTAAVTAVTTNATVPITSANTMTSPAARLPVSGVSLTGASLPAESTRTASGSVVHAERLAETAGEHVVGELVQRPLP